MNKLFLLVYITNAIVMCASSQKLHTVNEIISDEFTYLEVPKKYYSDTAQDISDVSLFSTNENGYDLSKDISRGDIATSPKNTKIIEEAIKNNNVVLFPDFPIFIDDTGIEVTSNTTLIFQTNSELRIVPNSKERYEILRIHNKENITLVSPKIRGDRLEHTGLKGEWGMGIAVRSSKNIKIYNASISHCWGDGIYVGQISANHSPSRDIFIYNPILDFNRRNGLSITSVDGLELIKPLISNTYGILPMCGIDVEPGNSSEIIQNVNIVDPITYNNFKGGIVVNLSKLSEVENTFSTLNITGHVDEFSTVGFYISGINIDRRAGHQLQGEINVINSRLINNPTPINMGSNPNLLPTINLENIAVVKKGSNSLNSIIKRTEGFKNVKVSGKVVH